MTIQVWPANDVFASFARLKAEGIRPCTTMLDPWYNKGTGGIDPDYDEFIIKLLDQACEVSTHVFLWGFPEILARFIGKIPVHMELGCWLTWYYKNNPSVIRGWRSGQQACLHIARPKSVLYPEHFLNKVQLEKYRAGDLRYMPGPTSVIESALIIGFIRKNENFGHPSPKPVALYDKLIRMTTLPNDLVFDPMAGSGTTGVVCRIRDRRAILCDRENKYVEMCEHRLIMDYDGWAARLDKINNNPESKPKTPKSDPWFSLPVEISTNLEAELEPQE